MRVFITGAGRSGTCWVSEIVRLSGRVEYFPKESIEDEKVFKRDLPRTYATKWATENFSQAVLAEKMEEYPDLHVIFVLRHPIDNCLSKMYRGLPSSKGGDGEDKRAEDTGKDGAATAVKHTFKVLEMLKSKYCDRLLVINLVDLIERNKLTVEKIAKFLGMPKAVSKMYIAHRYNRNKFQLNRYKKNIDKSQVNLRANWDKIYGGFFRDRQHVLFYLYEQLKNEISIFEKEK